MTPSAQIARLEAKVATLESKIEVLLKAQGLQPPVDDLATEIETAKSTGDIGGYLRAKAGLKTRRQYAKANRQI